MKRQRARVERRAQTRASKRDDRSVVGPRLRFAAVLGLSTVSLFVLRLVFVALRPRIIAAAPPVDPMSITPWARWAVLDPDGIELPVASAGMLFFLGETAAVARFSEAAWRRVVAWLAIVLGLGLALAIVVRTRTTEFLPPSDAAAGTLLFVVGAALLLPIYLAAKHAGRMWRTVAVVGVATLLTIALVLSLPGAAVIDYSYYIGPALKHMQGSRLGSFYMQYDLLGTLIVEGMMRARLQLHQIQLVMTLLLAGWYGLYWLLIRRLFKHRFVGLMLFFALVIVRFLNIEYHPALTPQVLPHRLDMWVPLILLSTVWGLDSIPASVAFAVSYALDSTFGFLAAGIYVLALCAATFSQRAMLSTRSAVLRLARRTVPVVLVAVAQKLVFGSIASPAASYYLNVKLGFLPISPDSLFWPVALLVGWAAATFVIHREERSSRWGLLICLFAIAQLTYFFGRSHDHNLLNIASVWLFAIFLAIDQASELGRFAAPVAAGLVLFSAFMGARRSAVKIDQVVHRVQSGVVLERNPVERRVDLYRRVASPNVMLLELADAYYNYRLGLPQRGFFTPLNANVFVDQTAVFLDDQLDRGVVPIVLDTTMAHMIGDLNRAPTLRARGHQFVGYSYGDNFIGIRRAAAP